MIEVKKRERLERLLTSEYRNDFEHALHMSDLEHKNKVLKLEITMMRERAEWHNVRLYATGLIVNCTGCERGKPFDGEQLTEERVREVESIADRLRTWFSNHKHRVELQHGPSQNRTDGTD